MDEKIKIEVSEPKAKPVKREKGVIPWAKEIKMFATPEEVETALYNAGIKTAEDVYKNPQAIIGAFNAAYKSGLAEVLTIANKYKIKE